MIYTPYTPTAAERIWWLAIFTFHTALLPIALSGDWTRPRIFTLKATSVPTLDESI